MKQRDRAGLDQHEHNARTPPFLRLRPIRFTLVVGSVVFGMAAAGGVLFHQKTTPASRPLNAKAVPAGPPWIYGRPDARYTVIEYADLECPFCRAYFPNLKRWIDANPDVNWRWHHLPLPMHDPAATDEARLAECAGLTGGHAAFWQAVAWIYDNTRGDGQGLPRAARYPGLTAAVQQCLDSGRPAAAVQAQTDQAGRDNIAATPTLRLLDRKTGRTLLVSGPVEDDALLSAIDLLAAPAAAAPAETFPMSADGVGDMPR